jgi:hypothetical protein
MVFHLIHFYVMDWRQWKSPAHEQHNAWGMVDDETRGVADRGRAMQRVILGALARSDRYKLGVHLLRHRDDDLLGPAALEACGRADTRLLCLNQRLGECVAASGILGGLHCACVGGAAHGSAPEWTGQLFQVAPRARVHDMQQHDIRICAC